MIVHAARPGHADKITASLFDQLKEAHADLLRAIEALDRLTREPLPDKDVLVNVRWQVSQASLSRRLLWGRIHARLSGGVDAETETSLRQLQETDIRLIRASAKHVGQWTVGAIIDGWSEYCRASGRMRREMIAAVTEEKRLLYPILSTFQREQNAE